jgi:hypothetical protein
MSNSSNAINSTDGSGHTSDGKPGFRVSLDVWAVALALALSLLVWSGVIKRVPW